MVFLCIKISWLLFSSKCDKNNVFVNDDEWIIDVCDFEVIGCVSS